MLHNMLHNLLAGIEEHDWVVLHQPGQRFLNQCSPNPEKQFKRKMREFCSSQRCAMTPRTCNDS